MSDYITRFPYRTVDDTLITVYVDTTDGGAIIEKCVVWDVTGGVESVRSVVKLNNAEVLALRDALVKRYPVEAVATP